MEQQSKLSDVLARCREESYGWESVYDDFVARLRRIGAGETSPEVGEPMPDFALPNSRGVYVRLEQLIAEGPLVLSFNRGGWCPYCRSELTAWSEVIPDLKALGGNFAAITGEVGGRAERMRAEIGLDAEMLCDVDHGVALGMGLAFPVEPSMRRRYLDCGLDLTDAYGSASWFLPIPATYVIDQAGIVRYAYANPDFRLRAEPAEVLDAVRAIRGRQQ
jgi:peroxiredoxin